MHMPGEFFSPQQFSEYSHLSLSTVHRYLKRGKLPYVQPGGERCRILIPASALTNQPSKSTSCCIANGTANSVGAVDHPNYPAAIPQERLPGPEPRWARGRGRS
jgi:hypothetical protein